MSENTPIKLHFWLGNLGGNDGSGYREYNKLRENVIKSETKTKETDLKNLNNLLLEFWGHMGISFPQSSSHEIYGFGPKITKDLLVEGSEDDRTSSIFQTPDFVFDPRINLEGVFDNCTDFFHLMATNNNDVKKIGISEYVGPSLLEFDLEITEPLETALLKLHDNQSRIRYGYKPLLAIQSNIYSLDFDRRERVENCITYIFNQLGEIFYKNKSLVHLEKLGELRRNVVELIKAGACVTENVVKISKNKKGGKKTKKKTSKTQKKTQKKHKKNTKKTQKKKQKKKKKKKKKTQKKTQKKR